MAKEKPLLNQLAMTATRLGHRLFRNNSGRYMTRTGGWVQYGVASPGGSDMIGWTTVVVTPEMVGKRIAVFTAVEAKTEHTKVSEVQQYFIDAVKDAGGIALVARELGDYIAAVRG